MGKIRHFQLSQHTKSCKVHAPYITNASLTIFWRLKVIPSANFFVLRAISNGVPTLVNLRLRGVILNNVTCVMCSEQEETINHLLFTCKVAAKIWNMCYKWTGTLGVNHNKIQAYFEHFHLMITKGICYGRGCGLL